VNLLSLIQISFAIFAFGPTWKVAIPDRNLLNVNILVFDGNLSLYLLAALVILQILFLSSCAKWNLGLGKLEHLD
jgi:hypothetical protein